MRGILPSAIIAIILLASQAYAGFTFNESFNGSNVEEFDPVYKFSQPTGIFATGGKIFVVDGAKNSLYVMNGSRREKAILTNSNSAQLVNPMRMAYSGGVLYIADGIGGGVKTYSGVGYQIDKWNEAANIQRASGVALTPLKMYISDMAGKQVTAYSRETKAYVETVLRSGPSDGQLSSPADIEVYQDRIFVSDSSKGVIFAYDSNFTFLSTIGRGKGGVTLTSPRGIQASDGMLYVADTTSNRVVVFTMDGYPIDILNASVPGGDFSYPEDLSVDGNMLYVTDTGNQLVKAFKIDPVEGDASVLALIAAANDSIARLVALQAAATKLGLTLEQTDAGTYLLSAQTEYDNYDFESAAANARKAIGASSSAQLSTSQSIETRITQICEDAQKEEMPFRNDGSFAVKSDLAQIDNRITDAKNQIAAKAYESAVDSVLPIPSIVAKLQADAQGKKDVEAEMLLNRTASQYGLWLDAVAVRFERLKAKSGAFRQDIDLTNSEKLLSSAKEAIVNGDFDFANRSLSYAETEIGLYESSVDGTSLEISEALANITILELQMNSSLEKALLVPADFTYDHAAMVEAKNTAYSNPSLAIAMAKQASEGADKKMKEAQSLSVLVASLGIVLGLIGVVSILFFIHLRRRRKEQEEMRTRRRQ